MGPTACPEVSVTTTNKSVQHPGRAKKAKLISRSQVLKYRKIRMTCKFKDVSFFLLLGKELLKNSLNYCTLFRSKCRKDH